MWHRHRHQQQQQQFIAFNRCENKASSSICNFKMNCFGSFWSIELKLENCENQCQWWRWRNMCDFPFCYSFVSIICVLFKMWALFLSSHKIKYYWIHYLYFSDSIYEMRIILLFHFINTRTQCVTHTHKHIQRAQHTVLHLCIGMSAEARHKNEIFLHDFRWQSYFSDTFHMYAIKYTHVLYVNTRTILCE